jgi:hypothetical protein
VPPGGTGTTGVGSGVPVVPVPEAEDEPAGKDEVGDAPALGVAEPVGGRAPGAGDDGGDDGAWFETLLPLGAGAAPTTTGGGGPA